ncbi:MAG: Gfo/Idh/MocA family oxidoreductase [Chloroflexi bacterium]|nr:Gfo/Idh/MocA family oxidoreductase [Chloroflexota bacterium]
MIKAGIIGAGLMGRWHAAAIRRAGGVVVAVLDRNIEAAKELAKKHRIAECYSNETELFARTDLDVVHVCSPISTHYGFTLSAIQAGLHTLIEKPVTPVAADAKELIDLAAKQELLICPVYQNLFQDGTLKAKRLLSRIGRLVALRGMIHSAGGIDSSPTSLGDIAAEILPHPLSLMQSFLPHGLENSAWVSSTPTDGEFQAVGEANGITLAISISMSARPTLNTFQIVGTAGTLHLDLFHGYAYREPGIVSKTRKILRPFDLGTRMFLTAVLNLSRRAINRKPAYPGLFRLVDLFYNAVRDGSSSPISPEDVLAVENTRLQILQK